MTEPRGLLARLQSRHTARTPWEEFDVAGGDDLVWDHRPVPMSQFRMPEAGPNAPLLKRIIRYPAVMEAEPPKRIQVFDGERPKVSRQQRDPIPMTFRQNAELRAAPGPFAELEHGPEDRDHPMARARRAAEERKDRRGVIR